METVRRFFAVCGDGTMPVEHGHVFRIALFSARFGQHLASLGAREVPRADFMRNLQELVNYSREPGRWTLDLDIID